MKLQTLADLFRHQLHDLYGAESQMLYALPRMARSASHPALMEGFDSQHEKTKDHLERLLDISDDFGCRCHTRGGKGLEPILDKAWSQISDASDELVRDARLLHAAQSAAHYEIAAYQAAWFTAASMGQHSIAALLHATLQEERAAGRRLSALSRKSILSTRVKSRHSLSLARLPLNARRMLPQKRAALCAVA
jgi:ferritin-like metal-binding protein YciE